MWFSFLIGGLEFGGAILLLVPRLTSYVAILLIAIMIGALGTELLISARLGPVMPTVHIVILSILLAARWKYRWRASGSSASSGGSGGIGE